MTLGIVVALALGAVPATHIQSQKPGDVAKKLKLDQAKQPQVNEQEGRSGPAIPASMVTNRGTAQQGQSGAGAEGEQGCSCAQAASACEEHCQSAKSGDELSCKAHCKSQQMTCPHMEQHKSGAGQTSSQVKP